MEKYVHLESEYSAPKTYYYYQVRGFDASGIDYARQLCTSENSDYTETYIRGLYLVETEDSEGDTTYAKIVNAYGETIASTSSGSFTSVRKIGDGVYYTTSSYTYGGETKTTYYIFK